MQRWATTLLGLAVVLLAVWLVIRNFQPPKPIGRDPNPPAAASADSGGALASSTASDAGAAASAGGDDAGPLLLSDLLAVEPRMDGGAGGTMPDGTPVPPLPVGVPRQVRFGVVLVSYAGAQPSASAVGSGRPITRSKTEAKALAEKLLVTAQTDFHAAVQQGDPGSADDLGHVKLGVLEPAPEFVLFTLSPDSGGGVGGPVDTPRGFWIVKRLD
jgi:hypothetical protein